MTSTLKKFQILALLIFTAFCSTPAFAQGDEIETQFRQVNAEEEKRLRAILAEPIPEGVATAVLRKHFTDKDAAAGRLAEPGGREAVLRQAVQRLPDAYIKNNLARQLLARGEIAEGNALMLQAIASAPPYEALIMKANAACDLLDQNKYESARKTIAANLQNIQDMRAQATREWQQRQMARSAGKNSSCLSSLEQRLGKFEKAISAASDTEKFARQAMALAAPSDSATMRGFLRSELATSLARKLNALRAAGRISQAEVVLAEYMRLSSEQDLPASFLAGIYSEAGNLRFVQREFTQAEAMARKSDAVLARLGYDGLSGGRPSRASNIASALMGQKNWPAALAIFNQLDALAGDDAKLKSRIRFGYDRGVAYLGNGRYAQAADLFSQSVINTAKVNGETHFFTAQSRGLQGVALWRLGTPESRAQALPLLKTAVRDYMAPANADYLENTGYRKERREDVFATYLEALATTPGENAVDAIGPADWVRSGSVQDALNDAAVRAAASTPALADVVRLEQDAKNEIAGLRRYLSGEAGSAASPLPEIAAQIRTRISVLDAERSRYQLEIKAKFPDYERLVRPTMPGAQDIARQLDANQALLMVLPTTDAVYVWAIPSTTSDKPAAFARVVMQEAEVNRLVIRLRSNLDFASVKGVPTQFDSAAAHTLYQRLIAPVNSALQGKTQWIVATGGALSQLPFAVLHTQAGGGAGPDAPWLVKQAAMAQVPSLSAWLALKSIAKNKPAAQAFIGWGDPVFSNAAVASALPGAQTVRKVAIAREALVDDVTTDKISTRAVAPSALRYADIPPLPETRDELLAIANTLRANAKTDVLLGASATRDSVLTSSKNGQLSSRRVVAFATHGLMAGDLPNLSQPALALAASNADASNPLAPLLTLDDVLTLKLNADWVVLSACNTAAADGRAEEALSGLARGFFYAGARSLLVTHWAVDSASATQLTTATFEHYSANLQAPKAESLRQAMLKVMATPAFAHPAYWAPYALVGDGGR